MCDGKKLNLVKCDDAMIDHFNRMELDKVFYERQINCKLYWMSQFYGEVAQWDRPGVTR